MGVHQQHKEEEAFGAPAAQGGGGLFGAAPAQVGSLFGAPAAQGGGAGTGLQSYHEAAAAASSTSRALFVAAQAQAQAGQALFDAALAQEAVSAQGEATASVDKETSK